MDDWKKDKLIAHQVREMLQNREEPYQPGAWENFILYRRKRKRMIYAKYIVSITACLLILFTVSHFFVNHAGSNLLSEIPTPKQPETSGIISEISEASLSKIDEEPMQESYPSEDLTAARKSRGQTDPLPDIKVSGSADSGLMKSPQDERVGEGSPVERQKEAATEATSGEQKELTEQATSGERREPADSAVLDPGSGLAGLSGLSEREKEKWSAGDRTQKGGRKVRFGLNLSPGMHATSSDALLAIAGGVSADIHLSRTLSITTGIHAEQQQFSETGPSKEYLGVERQTTADLLCIDIPVNLTWDYLHRKGTTYYLSGGLSSLLYVKEDYKVKSTSQELVEIIREDAGGQEQVTYEMQIRETTRQHSSTPFQHFHPAGRLNLVAGVRQQISPVLSLHVEPYVKLPLMELGSEKVRFVSGGINFKVSF